MTGNKTVDEVSKLGINSIPENWYMSIRKNNQPHALAILVLWDLIYWYKWTEVRDEKTGLVVSYKKKFSDSQWLQRNYEQIGTKFGISKKVAYETILFLEKLGVVVRHQKTIQTIAGKIPNVLFLEVVPEVLKDLTYNHNISQPVKTNTPEQVAEVTPEQEGETLPIGGEAHSPQGVTYTTTTTNNTTTTTTNTTTQDSSLSQSPKNTTGESKKKERKPKVEKQSFALDDYKQVYTAYADNWAKLYSVGKVKTDKPCINFSMIAKTLKNRFETFGVEPVVSAVKTSLNDSWLIENGYPLSFILGQNKLPQLINGGTTKSKGSQNKSFIDSVATTNYEENW